MHTQSQLTGDQMNTAIGIHEDRHVPPLRYESRAMVHKTRNYDTKSRFDRLVAPLQVDLLRYSIWLCRDFDLAQEIVQETMLRAWRALDSLRNETAARQWLLTIARREHARFYERKQIAVKDIEELTEDETLQAAIHEDDELYDIRCEILALRKTYREPLVLQALLGLSMKEIADVLDLTVSTVCVRLHRARLALAKNMRGDERLTDRRRVECERVDNSDEMSEETTS